MRKQRIITLFIIAVPIMAVSAGSIVFLWRLTPATINQLPEVLKAAASERIDGDLTIGRIKILPSGIEMADVVVTDASDVPVVKIPRVKVKCSLADVALRRIDPLESIERIDLQQPSILLERAPDGRWNIVDLLKPSKPGQPAKFGGKIRVTSGRIMIRDRKASLSRPEENTLTNLDATLDLSEMPVVEYSVSGRGKPGRLERFSTRGRYNLGNHSFNADLDILNASAAQWSTYPWRIGLDVSSGAARAKIRISRRARDKPLDYAANIQVRGASVRFHQIRSPVQNLAGQVNVRKGVVSIRLKGKLQSSPIFVSGQVLGLKSPRLALKLESDGANFRELAEAAGYARRLHKAVLPQSGNLRALIFGPHDSPAVDFVAEAASLTYEQFRARSVSVKGTYVNRRFIIDRASASILGGSVEATGKIDLSGKPSALLSGHISRLNIGDVPSFRKHGLSGTSTGEFVALLETGKTDASLRGTVDSGQLRDVRFDHASIMLKYSDGAVHIQELGAKMLGGLVILAGEMRPDGSLDLDAAGSDINLASVRDLYWSAPTVGRAYFAGKIAGTIDSPIFEGDIEAHRVMVSGLGMERISGSLRAADRMLGLDNLTIHDYPGKVSFSGSVLHPLGKTPKLDLLVEVDSVDVDRLTSLQSNPILTEGTISARLSVSGALRNPSMQGEIRVQGSSYRDTAIDEIEAQVAYKDEELQVSKFRAQSGNCTLSATGEISRKERIAGEFSISRLPMAKLSDILEPHAFVSGTANISGSFAGTTASPRVDLGFEWQNPAVNGQTFGYLSGKARVEGDTLTVSDVLLSDGDARYTIRDLSYNSRSKLVGISAQVENGSAGKLLALIESSPSARKSPGVQRFLRNLPRPFTGTVNGTISGDIRLTNDGPAPNLSAEATVADLSFGRSSIKMARGQTTWQDGILRLEKLEALDEDTNMVAEGSLGPANAISLRVDAHGLPLDALRQLAKVPYNFSGKADVTIVASGTTVDPRPEVSIEIVDPVIGVAKFDRLRSRLSAKKTSLGSSDVTLDRLYINNLTLTRGAHDLKASGYVPVNWQQLAIPSDSPILLRTNLDSGSLQLLTGWNGTTAETDPAGSFDGSVLLSGTVSSPKLEGYLAWHGGQLRLPRINSPLEKINAQIMLRDDKLSVEQFEGTSAEGGSFAIGGDVALAGFEPSLNLSLNTDGLTISGRDITNAYGEEIRARLDSTLQISGNWRKPHISGEVEIPDGSISLSSKPREPQPKSALPAVDPSFDIAASLAKDVEIRSARFRSPLLGKVTVSGSLSKPIVTGNIDISDGVFAFPMREFKILPNSIMELRIGTEPQPPVFVDMRAQTRLTAVTALAQRKRYTVTMTARGPLDRLEPTFSSSPPGLSEQTIVALLTGQRQLEQILSQNGIGRELPGLFSTAVMPSVFEPIEQAFESALGFREFSLEMGYREPLQLTIGKQLSDRLYLDYSAFLGARPDYADSLYELRLSYRFKHGLELGLTTDEYGTLSTGVGGKLRF